MAYSGIAKLALKLIRETMKKNGVEAGVELGKRIGAPQQMIHTAIMRSTKKNPYGTFAQRKLDRIKAMEKARMLGGGGPKRGYERRIEARAGKGFIDPANIRPAPPVGRREQARKRLAELKARLDATSPAGIVPSKSFSTKGWKDIKRRIDEEELLEELAYFKNQKGEF
jgi:hypothetical protein